MCDLATPLHAGGIAKGMRLQAAFRSGATMLYRVSGSQNKY